MNNLPSILQHFLDCGVITAKAIAAAARVSSSTAYRWIAGETLPTYEELRSMVARLPEIVGRSILDDLVGASTFAVARRVEAEPEGPSSLPEAVRAMRDTASLVDAIMRAEAGIVTRAEEIELVELIGSIQHLFVLIEARTRRRAALRPAGVTR